MKPHHDVRNVGFEGDQLVATIDGVRKSFPLKNISSALANASELERKTMEISPAGYGIHWPLLDEDISIDGLLGIVHMPSGKRKIA